MKAHKLTTKAIKQDNSPLNGKPPLARDSRRMRSCLLVYLSLALTLCIALHSTPSAATPLRLARLYSVTGGTVYLQRPNWSVFYATYPRTMLTGDDLLDVPVGAEVVLLCPDGNRRNWLGAGISNVGSVCLGTPRIAHPR